MTTDWSWLPEGVRAFEADELTDEETDALFQRLVDSGGIERLPESYRRTAAELANQGKIRPPVRYQPTGPSRRR